jgi:hypothetical protein
MLLNLTCTACGAPLGVPDGTPYATCAHCGSRLAIRHGEGAQYTEVLAAVDRRTERIEADVATLRLQNELAQLDREWEMSQTQAGATGGSSKHGAPLVLGALFVGAIMLFGLMSSGGFGSAPPAAFIGSGRSIPIKDGQTVQEAIDSLPDGYLMGSPSINAFRQEADSQFQLAAGMMIVFTLLAGGVGLVAYLQRDGARQRYEQRRAQLLAQIDRSG